MIHMGWKCTPQLTGLVRGEPKPGQKHRSNVKAIAAEAGKERVSNSDTLDRDRTHLNRYTGFSSGFECADYITKEADDYKQEVIGKGGAKHYRKLRADAVIGYAIIYNPPEEICCNWTDEEYKKFYEDSKQVMEQIQPNLFRRDTVVMSAEHFDEGTITNPEKVSRHLHEFGIPRDANGNYCGNKIDAKLLADINKNYPRMMRQRGWDIDDLDCTDWDKYKTDETYRKERKSKKKSGKDVNNYIADKMRKQIQENEDMSEIMCSAILDALEVSEEKDRLEEEKEQIEENKEILRLERMQFEQERTKFFKRVIEQEKKEKDFQHKDDMLEAQRNVLVEKEQILNQREAEMHKEQTRYKLSLKSKYAEKYKDYKADCDEKVRKVVERANELPDMAEVVEYAKRGAYMPMRMGGNVPLQQFIQRQQQSRERYIRDIPDMPYTNDFDREYGD